MPTTYTDVDTYIDLLAASRQPSLQQLRHIILETVPGAEETIQYSMPYYTYHGMHPFQKYQQAACTNDSGYAAGSGPGQ